MEISLRQAAERLANAQRLVLSAHIHPDGDSLGSMLALYLGLRHLGKEVVLMLDDEIPSLFSFLPGIDNIVRPLNDIRNTDLLVILDASDADRAGQVIANVHAPVLNIDHHVSNTKFADYWYIDTEAAATGEIILTLLRLMKVALTKDIAICLYTAIATDCGFFRFANTTSQTLRYAADLIDCGVQPHIVSEHIDTRPLTSLTLLTKVLETLELHQNGKIASISVLPTTDDESTEGFISYPRNIEGVEIAIMFKIVDENAIRVSFRSRRVDVSRLALSFGGGGHARASGCTINESLVKAKEKVLAAAIKALRMNPND